MFDRRLWETPFTKWRPWLCPTCQAGNLVLRKQTLSDVETGASEAAHDHDAWEPDWIEKRFSAILVCSNGECKEAVAVSGSSRVVEVIEDRGAGPEPFLMDAYTPAAFCPAPPIFAIPEQCPDVISQELRRAFALLWIDIGSSANRLRSAVEALLTERKVPKYTTSKKGKRIRLDLHSRIDRFRKKNPDAAHHLEAVKWLGNSGSHNSLDALSLDALLSGFELFEHTLDRVYVRREERLKKLASGINRHRGPVKPGQQRPIRPVQQPKSSARAMP